MVLEVGCSRLKVEVEVDYPGCLESLQVRVCEWQVADGRCARRQMRGQVQLPEVRVGKCR